VRRAAIPLGLSANNRADSSRISIGLARNPQDTQRMSSDVERAETDATRPNQHSYLRGDP